MGFERDDEDPHRGTGATPKLTLAGRIDGTVDGWPVSLVAERRNLVLDVGRFRTLLTIRRGGRSTFSPIRSFLAWSDIRLLVRIGWLGSVEVLPNPSYLVRLMLP